MRVKINICFIHLCYLLTELNYNFCTNILKFDLLWVNCDSFEFKKNTTFISVGISFYFVMCLMIYLEKRACFKNTQCVIYLISFSWPVRIASYIFLFCGTHNEMLCIPIVIIFLRILLLYFLQNKNKLQLVIFRFCLNLDYLLKF